MIVRMVWAVVLGALVAWLLVGLVLAVVLGRGVRLADRGGPAAVATGPLTVADLLGLPRAAGGPAAG